MNEFTCSKCLFAADIGSSDLIRCTALSELRKANEPACGKFTKGSFYEAKA